MSVFKQLLLICLLGGIGYGCYWGYETYLAPPAEAAEARDSGPVTIEVAAAETQRLYQTVEAVGTTRAAISIEIVPESDGRIVELAITPGAQVEQGALLVRLDDAIERADLAEAEARLTERRQVLERIEQLRSTNAVSQASLEEAVARLAEAEAQLDRARQRLDDRTILAPFAGVLGLAEVDRGARVTSDDVITRLDDLSEVELEFSLPETLFAQVRRGMTVEARSVAFDDHIFEGQIDTVDSRIDPVSRAFRTRAVIPNPEGLLPAGMFMSLTLTLSESDALMVPEEAIVFQAAETYVFGVSDGVAIRTPVRTGQRQDGQVAILSGLQPGQEVAIRGLGRLRDGAEVKVKAAELSPDASEGDT
ncbi:MULTISPECIES: efflux RND transporter periplasmic adaptor subunit [Roseovarius]|uniref:efflux RND transporter periplasmic adaptor subunit n=1 Tax=Roseovarius TaxID=74030 RepID=UPI001C9390DA|nr:efflux RND transporter periplasmic adaptor subunit [Roseovarius atlanticus]MBY5988619.1 efflux RND transporter periplasmic adaptor subunit [Roseovarius atlanticus]MBY6124009.1 efflux RND transporter periplasmic adaptor subunit [Roseovarius atlanticus]MBY6148504.1 efflux RND transporter periplasmic adaptor subunit [Roseovarius atlanticus]